MTEQERKSIVEAVMDMIGLEAEPKEKDETVIEIVDD